jgi:hypothetical protein
MEYAIFVNITLNVVYYHEVEIFDRIIYFFCIGSSNSSINDCLSSIYKYQYDFVLRMIKY